MTSREIANVVWALGQCRTLKAADPQKSARQLLQDLSAHNYQQLFQGGNAKDVAQLLHGMARLKLKDENTLAVLAKFIHRYPYGFEAKHLALSAWAFSKLNFKCHTTMVAIAERLAAQKLYLRPWSMSAAMAAYAKFSHHDAQLCSAVAEVSCDDRCRLPWLLHAECSGQCMRACQNWTLLLLQCSRYHVVGKHGPCSHPSSKNLIQKIGIVVAPPRYLSALVCACTACGALLQYAELLLVLLTCRLL